MLLKNKIAWFKGDIQGVANFYNGWSYKIKASQTFPETMNGSSTGMFWIIIFYDGGEENGIKYTTTNTSTSTTK